MTTISFSLLNKVLEPTRGGNELDLILSFQNDLVDNVKVHEPLGCLFRFSENFR